MKRIYAAEALRKLVAKEKFEPGTVIKCRSEKEMREVQEAFRK